MKEIEIKGAKIHNLKNIDISIPKNKLIVATGVSGSGKSSLMFDIVFDEGRKKYLESIGILTGIDDENKFDSIKGLGPAIAVKQNIIRQSNPRSTVGSRTNIINMMSLLYSTEGDIKCQNCSNIVSSNLKCSDCGNVEDKLDQSFFSYNSSSGMCMKCSGRGSYFEIDVEQIIPDQNITLEKIFKNVGVTSGYMRVLFNRLGEHFSTSFCELPEEIKYEVLYGHYENGKPSYSITKIFQGRYQKGEDVKDVYSETTCTSCNGFRIGEEARRVLLNGYHIAEICVFTISEAYNILSNIDTNKSFTTFGKNLLTEILSKLNNLIKSNLGHLSLYREMSTLSGGEIQRLFLNSHLDSDMDSLIYVLDEPTAGLHESEKSEILKSIQNLNKIGNTVIVVEHDKSTIEIADHIIDIGPKAGSFGGELVYQGDLDGLLKSNDSLTGKYISGKIQMPERKATKSISDIENSDHITIKNASVNNLKDITVSFPLNSLVGVAGKSGSGKSSLISNSLLPALKSCLRSKSNNDSYDEIYHKINSKLDGLEFISGFAEISQAPIGRNSNSNPASYIGIWDKIRVLFSEQISAKNLDMNAGHFSFNSKGACPNCKGSGIDKIWLGSDLSIYKKCEHCDGKRFNEESLSIRYKDKNIYEVLEMSVSEAIEYFEGNLKITSPLNMLDQIGMGYIKLGQPTPTLSGGESQRIKLAKEIGQKRKGNTLYILDEPTTGLSLYDTSKLIQLLDELVSDGNSVIVVEHDTEVLKVCDWIVELGKGGGEKGGYLIAEGTPQMLVDDPNSLIGRYL